MHVVATHVDVTDAVLASRRAELEQMAAAQERSRLLRQLGDMLATSRLGPEELLRTIVDLAAGDHRRGRRDSDSVSRPPEIERDVTAHPDESVRLRLAASLQRSARDPVPATVCSRRWCKRESCCRTSGSGTGGRSISESSPSGSTTRRLMSWSPRSGTTAPCSESLRCSERTRARPYQAGDDDVLQLLADGAGAAIAENRSWQQAERERDERLTALATATPGTAGEVGRHGDPRTFAARRGHP